MDFSESCGRSIAALLLNERSNNIALIGVQSMHPVSYLTAPAVEVDLAALQQDPHKAFRHYRPQTAAIKAGPTYYVLRARHVLPLITDSRTSQFEGSMMALRGYPDSGAMSDFMLYSINLTNGDVHRSRRSPLTRAFSKPAVERMRSYVRSEAQRIAEQLPRGSEFDFLEHFCSPLPGRIIAATAGLEPDEWQVFARLIYRMTTGFAPPFPADRWPSIESAAEEMYRYVTAALDDRRKSPREDFVTAFLAATEEAGELSEIEIRSVMLAVLLGGSDTTRGALNSLHGLLLEHRAQWEAVCKDPALIPGAIEEALRFEPPVASVPKMAAQAIDLDGVSIAAGSPLELMTISAMRDPEMYADPDTFDITRTGGPRIHPVFGGGAHRCAGEYLARMELEEGLRATAAIHPNMELVGQRRAPGGFSAIREAMPFMVRIPA